MKNYLLQLDLAADFLDLLLQSLGILLGQTLLHGGGSALDGSLGLGQTQTHDLTDDLDDLDLLSGIEAGQNDVEVGLLLSSGSSSAGSRSSHGSGGNAELLLQSVNQLAIDNAHVGELGHNWGQDGLEAPVMAAGQQSGHPLPEHWERALKLLYAEKFDWSRLVYDITYTSIGAAVVEDFYDENVVFLRFCFEKELLKKNPLDRQGRILRMVYLNQDLTKAGKYLFPRLMQKFLVFTDRNGKTSLETMLKRWYTQLEKEYRNQTAG